ncbi:hypothetical protein FDECE_14781, partial [Fusarium decemcellulare]
MPTKPAILSRFGGGHPAPVPKQPYIYIPPSKRVDGSSGATRLHRNAEPAAQHYRRRLGAAIARSPAGEAAAIMYLFGPRKSKTKVSVGDRIQQLEELVRSLVGQQQQTPALHPNGLSEHAFEASTAPLSSVDEDTLMPALRDASISRSRDRADSPGPSEPGSLRLHSHGVGASYVGSVHWAAVLESISELRDHYEEEEEARMLATNDHVLLQSPGPRLLYEPVQTTKADLLASIPARPVVDRMVAR